MDGSHERLRPRPTVRPPARSGRRDTRVVAALSGGSDSVALTHILRELEAEGSCASSGSPISTISSRHRPTKTNGAQPRLPNRLAGRSASNGRMLPRVPGANGVRRGSPARTARHAFFDRARAHFAPMRSRWATRATIRPRPFLLRLMSGAGLAGSGGDAPAQRAAHPAALVVPARRAARVSRRSRASRLSRTRRTPMSPFPGTASVPN